MLDVWKTEINWSIDCFFTQSRKSGQLISCNVYLIKRPLQQSRTHFWCGLKLSKIYIYTCRNTPTCTCRWERNAKGQHYWPRSLARLGKHQWKTCKFFNNWQVYNSSYLPLHVSRWQVLLDIAALWRHQANLVLSGNPVAPPVVGCSLQTNNFPFCRCQDNFYSTNTFFLLRNTHKIITEYKRMMHRKSFSHWSTGSWSCLSRADSVISLLVCTCRCCPSDGGSEHNTQVNGSAEHPRTSENASKQQPCRHILRNYTCIFGV